VTKFCDLDDTARCSRCGRVAYSPTVLRECVMGLGDLAAAGLAAVGITKERANAAAQAVGFDDCGCEGRQAWLNSIGRHVGIG
jgi:hypothetical protein